MATAGTLQSIERLLDDLYREKDELSREEIFRRVEEAGTPPEVMTYFGHLPEGDYTMDELVDEMNGAIREAGDTEDLGLLR